MQRFYSFIFLLCLMFFFNGLLAQKPETSVLSSVKGIAYDSDYHHVLPSATVAVYKAEDSSILSYQLANNLGEFNFINMPRNIILRLTIFYVGYHDLSKTFIIRNSEKIIDLEKLKLEKLDDSLQDVVVKSIPPVQMNGDTLEFNADAFKLDPNAVAEDLLRKLSGVIVWGDGTITVNGRQVRQVMVDGKLFFGGDTKVATQNIPKNAIDKIQVYQQANQRNSLDSVTDINIKLKKERNFGYFGKIGSGNGIRKRYAADGSLNLFNLRSQMSIAGATNNVNIDNINMNSLLRSSSYKGVGVSVDYQPNFTTQGNNRERAAGVLFAHNFTDDVSYGIKNTLNGNYFFNSRNSDIENNTQSVIAVGGDSSLTQNNNSINKNNTINHRFDARYDFTNKERALYVNPSFNITNGENHKISIQNSSSSWQGLQSTSNTKSDATSNGKEFSLQVGYSNYGDYYHIGNGRWSRAFSISYQVSTNDHYDNNHNQSAFTSLIDSSQKKRYDRKYQTHSTGLNQTLNMSLEGLERLLFHYRIPFGLGMQFQNKLVINTHRIDANVEDKDSLIQNYHSNEYLSYTSQYKGFSDLPQLIFNKTFIKSLPNRFSRTINLTFSPKGQFFIQQNISTHTFQNFDLNYFRFIPTASAEYKYDCLDVFDNTLTLNYNTNAIYPDARDLVPLTDSSDIYNLMRGNLNLTSAYNHKLSLNFKHRNYHFKNTLNYGINMDLIKLDDKIVDSSYYDNLGRRTTYMVNKNGFKSLSFGGNLNKAFKFNENQLQLKFNGDFSFAKNPNYVNGLLNISNSYVNNYAFNVYYSYKDIVSINGFQTLSFSRSNNASKINSYNYKTATLYSLFSIGVKCTNRLNINSNIAYNQYTIVGVNSATNYSIWNAEAYYRFLKQHNLELKVSALDILHQNRSIINYISNNMVTISTRKVLEQYFMLTLSYFPRKFGKKEDK